jgi:hypothetical protein
MAEATNRRREGGSQLPFALGPVYRSRRYVLLRRRMLMSGCRLNWLWVVTDTSLKARDRYSKAVSRLKEILARALRDGTLLGASESQHQPRSAFFATQAPDRVALLATYRQFMVGPVLEAGSDHYSHNPTWRTIA